MKDEEKIPLFRMCIKTHLEERYKKLLLLRKNTH